MHQSGMRTVAVVVDWARAVPARRGRKGMSVEVNMVVRKRFLKAVELRELEGSCGHEGSRGGSLASWWLEDLCREFLRRIEEGAKQLRTSVL